MESSYTENSSTSSTQSPNPPFHHHSTTIPAPYNSELTHHSQHPPHPSPAPDLEAPAPTTMTNILDSFAALSLHAPYGCTYLCGATFASALTWRQHEHRSHRQEELWRCAVRLDAQGTACGACAYSEATFVAHLGAAHGVGEGEAAAWVDEGHLFGEGQRNFWCGFCRRIVGLRELGCAAWDERLDHVEAHFANGDSVERGWLRLRQ